MLDDIKDKIIAALFTKALELGAKAAYKNKEEIKEWLRIINECRKIKEQTIKDERLDMIIDYALAIIKGSKLPELSCYEVK